jgi:hypothetical protein
MSWVMEINEGEIAILKELESNELDNLKDACKILNSLWNEDFANELNDEYQEYISSVENAKESTDKIISNINSYMGAYKGYIDRTRAYISRHKEKSFIQFYDSAVSEIYDRCFEYRFIYNLRNYSQHIGHPVSEITQSLYGKTKVVLEKDELITNHKSIQKPFKKELEAIRENELDVDKAIRVVRMELLELNQKLFNRELSSKDDHYLIASVTILDFYKKHSKNTGYLVITDSGNIELLRKMNNNADKIALQWSRIPHKLAESIIKGVYLKFKFKGKLVRKSTGFPFQYEQELVLEMPRFETGSKYVKYNNLEWVQIGQATGTAWEDGYERYFAIYIPVGLTMRQYDQRFESFQKEIDIFFRGRTSN